MAFGCVKYSGRECDGCMDCKPTPHYYCPICDEEVNETVFVPISVLPLYVLQVIVQLPEVPFGIWLASESGTVQAFDVPRSLPIVPVALPNLYVNVWSKLPEALAILIVTLSPIFTELADTVGVVALGIVVKACEYD
jgi:hypothetical protein